MWLIDHLNVFLIKINRIIVCLFVPMQGRPSGSWQIFRRGKIISRVGWKGGIFWKYYGKEGKILSNIQVILYTLLTLKSKYFLIVNKSKFSFTLS